MLLSNRNQRLYNSLWLSLTSPIMFPGQAVTCHFECNNSFLTNVMETSERVAGGGLAYLR